MIHLRPYQTDAVNKMRDLMRQGCRSILYTAPTGSGKTALTAHMLHTAAAKGMRSLFIVHRRELIKQSIEAFNKEGLDHGVISAGFMEQRTHRVQIASVQTLARRLARCGEPMLVIWDEAHHLAADSWSKIFAHFKSAYHIGLTATPERLDGKGLGNYFRSLICGPSVQTLTSQSYLSPYKLYAPSNVDLAGVHTRMGDYERSEISAIMDKPSIVGDAVAHYKKFCSGKRAIAFSPSIQFSQHLVERFNQEGINAEHVDGETPQEERDRVLEEFGRGSVSMLSNVELFGEGYDCPAAEVAILLRPTQSTGLYLQQIGRVLRPAEGKAHALILDHVGNWSRHGLPDDERTWSLEGSAGNTHKISGGISVKICPKCFAAQVSGQTSCKFCGFVFEIKAREVEEKDGELSEVDVALQRRKSRQEQGQAESLEELTAIGVSRGYKFPRRWAYYVFKSRQAKRLGRVA